MIAPARTRSRQAAGVAAVLLGTLIVPLDSAVNVDFPYLIGHFHLPIPLIQWVVISYTLATASLMLVCGRAADLVGHKPVFLSGCAVSVAAFVLCGLAPNYGWLLLFRVVQGIGAGLVLSCGPALITSLYSEAQRVRALGLYTAGFAAGGALGALLAGLFISRFGWSAVFWARAPVAALAGLLAIALPTPTARDRVGRFDTAGALLLVAALVALLLAINRVGDTVPFIALAVITVLSVWAFIRQQRGSAHPIIDLALFRNHRFATVNVANILINLAGFSVPLLVPFQFARLPDPSVVLDGALLALSPAGMLLGAQMAPRMAHRAPAARMLLVGTALVAVGLSAIALFAGRVTWLGAAMLVHGIGQGLFQVAYFDVVTASMPLRDRGVAGSLGMLTRTLGIVSGASVLVLIFQAIRTWSRAWGDQAAFLAGFRGALTCAALLAAGLLVAGLLRSRGRVRST